MLKKRYFKFILSEFETIWRNQQKNVSSLCKNVLILQVLNTCMSLLEDQLQRKVKFIFFYADNKGRFLYPNIFYNKIYNYYYV